MKRALLILCVMALGLGRAWAEDGYKTVTSAAITYNPSGTDLNHVSSNKLTVSNTTSIEGFVDKNTSATVTFEIGNSKLEYKDKEIVITISTGYSTSTTNNIKWAIPNNTTTNYIINLTAFYAQVYASASSTDPHITLTPSSGAATDVSVEKSSKSIQLTGVNLGNTSSISYKAYKNASWTPAVTYLYNKSFTFIYTLSHQELDLTGLTTAIDNATTLEESLSDSDLRNYMTKAINTASTFKEECRFPTYISKGHTPTTVDTYTDKLNAITDYVSTLNTAWGYEQSEVPNAVYDLLHSCDKYGDPNNSAYSTDDIKWATGVLQDAIDMAKATTERYVECIDLIDQYETANDNPTTHAVQYQNVKTAADDLEKATTVDALNTAMDKITKTLTLLPQYPSYPSDTYQSVTLSRTLKAGYNSLALPFETNVATLTGRTANEDDWVAQLETVTYNTEDGYTLYFKKGNGNIAANKPYVLYLTREVASPTWESQEVNTPEDWTVTPSSGYDGQDGIASSYADWTMRSNFAAEMPMAGNYGIVNSAGGLMIGGAGSTLNAFSAYIQPPTGAAGVKVQSAYIDGDGTVDYVPGLPGEASGFEDTSVYDLSGRRIQKPVRGLNIIRRSDGTTRKVVARK